MKKKSNNIHFFNLVLFFIFITFIIYLCIITYRNSNTKIVIEQRNTTHENPYNNNPYNTFLKPNYGYTNLQNVFLNPFSPPLRDERYIINDSVFQQGNKIPINIPTSIGYVDTEYRQIGILTKDDNNKEKQIILPLFARPLFTNRYKWNYYTIDEKNGFKLPIIHEKKSCTSEQGCNQIYSKEKIYIKAYDSFFRVELYDQNTIRYLPFV